MHWLRLGLLGVGGLLFSVSAAGAQSARRMSVDVSAGPSNGRGGESYENRAGIALDATVAWRMRSGERSVLLAGMSVGRQGSFGHDLTCLPAPTGGCVPNYPRFKTAALLAGLELGNAGGPAIRVLVGPTGYWMEEGERSAVGLHGRLDASTPSLGRLALVAAARSDLLPNHAGTRHLLGSFTVGIRVQ